MHVVMTARPKRPDAPVTSTFMVKVEKTEAIADAAGYRETPASLLT